MEGAAVIDNIWSMMICSWRGMVQDKRRSRNGAIKELGLESLTVIQGATVCKEGMW